MEDIEPSLGVEVILDSDLKKHPSCIHGPTLLFERYFSNTKDKIRRFYACSYSRNRKICNFFQFADPEMRESKIGKKINKSLKPLSLPDSPSRKEYESRYKIIKSLVENQRKYCHKCDKLLLPTEWKEHTKHTYLEKLPLEFLVNPTKIIHPMVTNQSNAQYFFTENTIKFVVETLKNYDMKKIICIGAPTIHHCIVNENSQMTSLLLDIDSRFVQFNLADEFCHYNLFNHYFFDNHSAENFYNFIACEDDMTLVVDPPFGGLIDVIAHTIKNIELERQNKCPNAKPLSIIWFFPYFNEGRIVKAIPELKMMDYKVEYSNHSSYKNSETKKKGSPVRIFTNLNPEKFHLPAEEKYTFCKICVRYISEYNRHCKQCNSCTSKDGSEYKHCNQCKRCVKGSRIHCIKCDICVLPNHECGKIIAKNTCHICGKQGHKRKECTSKESFQQQG